MQIDFSSITKDFSESSKDQINQAIQVRKQELESNNSKETPDPAWYKKDKEDWSIKQDSEKSDSIKQAFREKWNPDPKTNQETNEEK